MLRSLARSRHLRPPPLLSLSLPLLSSAPSPACANVVIPPGSSLPSPSPHPHHTPWAGNQSQPSSHRRQASTLPFTHSPTAPPPPPTASTPPSVLTHPSIPDLEITLGHTGITITCPSHGISTPFEVDHTWLRDSCQEVGSSLQQGTGQKLWETSDVSIVGNEGQGAAAGLLDPSHPPSLVTSPAATRGEVSLQLTYNTAHPVHNAFSQTFSPTPPESSSPTSHISWLPLSLLLSHASQSMYRTNFHLDPAGAPKPWSAGDLTTFPLVTTPPPHSDRAKPSPLDTAAAFARPSRVEWSSLVELAPDHPEARWALVKGLVEDGIAFVTGLPTNNKKSCELPGPSNASKTPHLAYLAQLLGEIRHTFYGPLWDVRSLPSSKSKNIAYTNVDLGFHMDLLYFQNPPRFQFLHMLRNQVKGGQSVFVDSFKIAEKIWKEDREAWDLLAKVPISYHYQNDNRHYRYSHPVFEVPADSSGHAGPSFSSYRGSSSSQASTATPATATLSSPSSSASSPMPRLIAVNYSPPFQSPLPLASHPLLADPTTRRRFYRALSLFSRLCLSPQFRYQRQLNEGECVLFDNRRVLHSRLGFEYTDLDDGEGEEEDQIKRWLKGCYVDGDAIWSSYRVLKRAVDVATEQRQEQKQKIKDKEKEEAQRQGE